MNSLLTLAGWLIAAALAAVAVSSASRLARGEWKYSGGWINLLIFALGAVIAFTALGVIGSTDGALLAVILAAWPFLEIMRATRKKGVRYAAFTMRHQVTGGFSNLRRDIGSLLSRLARDGRRPRVPLTYEPPEPAPVTEPRPDRTVPLPREVPSVRDDPALGTVPAAEEVGASLAGAGVAVPPVWAALIAEVAAFEPADDEELMLHLAGEAAGALGWGEGVRARADNLLHATGLDPAYVAGHLELADEIADLAAAVALVDRRFHVIYGAIREWVGNGGILPHRAREFFGGSDAAPATDADDQAA